MLPSYDTITSVLLYLKETMVTLRMFLMLVLGVVAGILARRDMVALLHNTLAVW